MEPLEQQADYVLLHGARDGDGQAFRAFYERYSKSVAAYLGRRGADSELAVALMAETFAAVLVTLKSNAPIPPQPAAWLFSVAQNKLVDALRRHKVEDSARRRLQMQTLVIEPSDQALLEALLTDESVDQILSELPPDQRQLVYDRVGTDKTDGQLANTVGTSELVVRKRISRALATLRSRTESTSA